MYLLYCGLLCGDASLLTLLSVILSWAYHVLPWSPQTDILAFQSDLVAYLNASALDLCNRGALPPRFMAALEATGAVIHDGNTDTRRWTACTLFHACPLVLRGDPSVGPCRIVFASTGAIIVDAIRALQRDAPFGAVGPAVLSAAESLAEALLAGLLPALGYGDAAQTPRLHAVTAEGKD
jgi:hypothetical protein